MSADHLTPTAPAPTAISGAVGGIGDAVRAVLAGGDRAAIAKAHAIAPADLDDAVTGYHAAGTAALEQAGDGDWFQALVEYSDWTSAEVVGARLLGPRLDSLAAAGKIGSWWFLRKYPCWRIRLRNADPTAVAEVLDELTEAGRVTRWSRTRYEPETTAFGGPIATGIVHDLFCADSAGILDYVRHPGPSAGRRELSLLLLNGLLQAAGLDAFERGDVFARTARLRPPPPNGADLASLIRGVRTFLSIPDLASSSLFAPGGVSAHAAPWLAAHDHAGRLLAEAAGAARLERGLRASLTHMVIFHWNRVGLSADQQGILAHAAAAALLPPD